VRPIPPNAVKRINEGKKNHSTEEEIFLFHQGRSSTEEEVIS
jgi:hypothetical protein